MESSGANTANWQAEFENRLIALEAQGVQNITHINELERERVLLHKVIANLDSRLRAFEEQAGGNTKIEERLSILETDKLGWLEIIIGGRIEGDSQITAVMARLNTLESHPMLSKPIPPRGRPAKRTKGAGTKKTRSKEM